MIAASKELGLNLKIGDITIEKSVITLLKSPLVEPFRISLGTQYDYNGCIVELISGETTGYGEGSTLAEITGESPSGIFETIAYILEGMKGKEYSSAEEFLYDANKSIYSNPTAKNSIDMALHDLIGKTNNMHVTKLLGGGFKNMPTCLTISIGSVEDNIKSLESLKRMKTKIIKVKVGKDPDEDIKRIKAISERLEGLSFFVDANQGYSLRDAMRVGRVLYDAGALFFEQPLEKHSLADLRQLRKQAGIPIMLDESISAPRDVIDSIISESVDMVNVKLTKSGGIRNAFKTLSVAQAYGIDAMVGCMIESKLGIAASLSVASSFSNVKFTDLDGFHSLSLQPFTGGLEYDSGINIPYKGPGLSCIPEKESW